LFGIDFGASIGILDSGLNEYTSSGVVIVQEMVQEIVQNQGSRGNDAHGAVAYIDGGVTLRTVARPNASHTASDTGDHFIIVL
jgi:hypothetical protein